MTKSIKATGSGSWNFDENNGSLYSSTVAPAVSAPVQAQQVVEVRDPDMTIKVVVRKSPTSPATRHPHRKATANVMLVIDINRYVYRNIPDAARVESVILLTSTKAYTGTAAEEHQDE